jgi:4-hydroxybenzoate polyprenyltransferase
MATVSPAVRDRLAGYATLVRVPNLFTAPPDVIAGAALVTAAGAADGSPPVAAVATLAVASMLLYAGGTALNDWADAPVDAAERPERPIPSGIVPRRAAFAVGVAALAGGVVLAAGLGAVPGGTALLLAVVVAAYDVLLKGGPAGYLAMGAARGLNVLLGASVAGSAALTALDGGLLGTANSAFPLVAVPPVVLGYIAIVTAMADDEATGGSRPRILAAGVASVLAATVVAAALLAAGPAPVALAVGLLALGAFLARNGGALRRAYADPAPGTVGPAVGVCVVGEALLVGGAAAAAGVGWALAALCFLVPATVLARRFDVS